LILPARSLNVPPEPKKSCIRTMIAQSLFLILGLAILLGGADILVRGVSSLAHALGVPPLVIGLTVVAFGTSTPELVISVLAALRGETGLTFGNIVGANTANIGLVLAIAAIVRPFVVEVSMITREIPMMLLGVASMFFLAMDGWLGGRGFGHGDVLERGDGIMLLLLFGVFLYYTITDALRRRSGIARDPLVEEVRESKAIPRGRAIWKDVLLLVGGLVGVAIGGQLAVGAAVELAAQMGVPQHIIALTVVAWGTTLPELATGIIAARRGQGDIAIGNVVGSVIYNLLCVGGIVATINPIPLPPGGYVDLLFMAALAAILLPLSIRGPRRITRGEGSALLFCYLAYTVARLVQGT
jgi:cation:H+ antiporter